MATVLNKIWFTKVELQVDGVKFHLVQGITVGAVRLVHVETNLDVDAFDRIGAEAFLAHYKVPEKDIAEAISEIRQTARSFLPS